MNRLLASPSRRMPLPAMRRGLTLVELLAVIAIIGLLVGLLMPALQSARESSRRTTCTGNLKTIATACLSHLEHIGTFPSAGWPQGSPNAQLGFNEDQPGGWLFNVLPFMELEALRNQNLSAAATCPPAFACPTMTAGAAVASTPTGNVKRGLVCYAGNIGSIGRQPRLGAYVSGSCIQSGTASGRLASLDKATREAAYPMFVGYGHRIAGVNDSAGYLTIPDSCKEDNSAGFINGIICTCGRIRSAHVTDGLQNTLMFGERSMRVNDLLVLASNGQSPCDTAAPWTGWGSFAYWRTTSAALEVYIQGAPWNTGCGYGAANPGGFGSAHGTTFGAAFCDGSVRHVGFDIDLSTVWRPLGSRNGGEIATPPW